MSKNILPPGTESFLSSQTGSQVESAMRSLYESVMLETALGERLTQLGIDLGLGRPPILFSDDGKWRAGLRALAYSKKHTRSAIVNFMELILGPRVSQGTSLTYLMDDKPWWTRVLCLLTPTPGIIFLR